MNILFIPHIPNKKVVNRIYEFAKSLDAYYLTWYMDNNNLFKKIFSQLKSLRFEIKNKEVQIPLILKPDNFFLNTIFLNKIIKKLSIDVVVNANATLFDIKNICVPVVYDLVDDHLNINNSIGLNLKRVKKIKEDIKNARGVVCVSEILANKVKSLNSNVITIENGLDIEKFNKSVSLKKELGLEHKRVFGYIGAVEKWTGIDKACDAFVKIKTNKDAMIIVGNSDSDFFKNLKFNYQKDILFIGSVEPIKVANYFKTIDIGLIPFELNDFTNNAFPIKALEYGLAGSNVISTPLKYLQYKAFPFIKFCDIKNFGLCMKTSKKLHFNFDFSIYNWDVLSNKYLDFIKDIL